jgi:tagatose-1,6-bisphosphate aldolase
MDLSIFQNQGKYLMLAFDHRDSFKKYVNRANPDKATVEDLIKVKGMVISALEDQFSGVLLDVDWGLAGYKSKNKPYLLPLERSGYTDVEGDRTTKLEYSAKQLNDLGASGTKLLLYLNPEAKNCEEQLATAKQALDDSHQNELPLFLEIVTYGNEELGKSRAEWVLRSVQMLIENNIVPDVWKLEYPGDFESCKKINELVGSAPWILLTRGEKFDKFDEQLKDAVSAGAVGFLAGRALWQEIGECKTDAERQEFLDKKVKKRFEIISQIALGS